MESFRIAVIPGDGIGPEVVGESLRVLDTASALFGKFSFTYHTFDWGCEYYLQHGRMMPDDGLQILDDYNAIVMGAVGFLTVPDHVSLWGLLLPIRRTFDQYVNLRPVKLLRGVIGPLRRFGSGDIDFLVVRENSEGEYSNMGGRLRQGSAQEIAVQNAIFTRYGTERIIRYAFELARKSRQHVTSATKSNGINYSMPFWDDVFREVARDYPDIQSELVHIDALAAYFITQPDTFDVVVASNLFGDILTDIGGAIQGGIGMAAAANLNPERVHPSMFEPVHGSAPTLVGLGVANPTGQIMTASMMVDFLGFPSVAHAIATAVEVALERGTKTRDVGGTAGTKEMTDAIIAEMIRQATNPM